MYDVELVIAFFKVIYVDINLFAGKFFQTRFEIRWLFTWRQDQCFGVKVVRIATDPCEYRNRVCDYCNAGMLGRVAGSLRA